MIFSESYPYISEFLRANSDYHLSILSKSGWVASLNYAGWVGTGTTVDSALDELERRVHTMANFVNVMRRPR